MPREARRVREYSELIVIEMRNTSDNLKNGHLSIWLSDSPMNRSDLMIQGNKIDTLKSFLQFINR